MRIVGESSPRANVDKPFRQRQRRAATNRPPPPTRRDFIFIATGAVAAVGGVFAVWPLFDQMNPDASTLALSMVEVAVSSLQAGASFTVKWQGRPVLVWDRTAHEIELARAVPTTALLDPLARNADLPADASATDENRAERPEWLITIGICTHLGCIPLAYQGQYAGYFCPCHGSLYDTAGRVRSGPAPENLHVPPYRWTSDAVVRIG